jgi:uncharacterized protein YozE (UPF0346 family)
MTFYTFMTRNYKNNDSPAGDLAGDMKSDSEKFPRNRPCKFKGWHEQLYKYLVENGACRDCLRTFEECWEEYVKCEKKRLKRS